MVFKSFILNNTDITLLNPSYYMELHLGVAFLMQKSPPLKLKGDDLYGRVIYIMCSNVRNI